MPAKKITRNDEVINKLRKGVSEVSDTVALTMGPRGQNIIIERSAQPPLVTKDGVSVAREITLEDGVEEMGAMLVIDAATKTADVAGDGTTAACVLSKAIYETGLKAMNFNKASKIKVAEGIREGVKKVCEYLKQMSRPVKSVNELISVATIAANSDHELGKLIGDAMNKTGQDGVVIVQEGPIDGIEFVDGMQVKSGMKHQAFQNKTSWVFEAAKPIIAVVHKMIASAYDIVPLLEFAVQEKRPVVLFMKDISAEAIQTMIMNKVQGKVGCCAIRIPEYGQFQNDMAEDIAAVVGAKVIGDSFDVDLKRLRENNYGKKWLEFVGSCDNIRVSKSETIIVNNKHGDERRKQIEARIEQARAAQETTTNSAEKDKYQRRIASLAGGVAKLMISAITSSELEQKKARVEDALYATKAAAEDGIVPGGGCALFYASKKLEDFIESEQIDDGVAAGMSVVAAAIVQPLIKIAENREVAAAPIVANKLASNYDKETDCWYGWDADSDVYGDMSEMKIIDPLRVPVTALSNAASVATLLLNTAGVIEYLQPEEAAQIASRGMHHAKVG